MAKLFLLSIILFSTILPVAVRARTNPRRTIRTIQIATLVAAFVWAYLCRSCYPTYVFAE